MKKRELLEVVRRLYRHLGEPPPDGGTVQQLELRLRMASAKIELATKREERPATWIITQKIHSIQSHVDTGKQWVDPWVDKIQVIRHIRALFDCSLRQAFDIVNQNLPIRIVVPHGITPDMQKQILNLEFTVSEFIN